MRVALATGVACLALATPACAASTDNPRTTVQRYFAALGRGDAAGACRQLTPGSQEKLKEFADRVLRLKRPSCEGAIGALLRSPNGAALRRLAHARITRIDVHGKRAEVRVARVNAPIDLARTAHGWRIDSEPSGEND